MTLSDRAAPLVSVVVPTRNRHRSLAHCLERVAPGAQTFDPAKYEVIVTDDGDAAATRPLLETQFPWARLVTGPGRGPASNRNAGAQVARGEWIVFTDDDTLPDAGWLAAIVNAIDGVDVVEGRTTCREGLQSPLEHAPVNETGGSWWSCNLAVKRDAFTRIGGFDERFRVAHMEDADFRERARRQGLIARFAPDAVVDHPPRRLPWGGALAESHYFEVLFRTIHETPVSLTTMLRRVTAARVRAVIARPALADGVSAAGSWLVEVVHIVTHWNAWRATAAQTALR